VSSGASARFDASILTGPVANYPVADSYNRRLERDYSTGDMPHVFVASAVWDLPFTSAGLLGALVSGWSVTGIVTLQSGVPIAVTQATNQNAFAGFGTERPNLVGDPVLSAKDRSPAQWFNSGAFAAAPQFTLGSASRNPVRGPSYRNLDLALMRQVPLGAVQISSSASRGSMSPTRLRSARRMACSGRQPSEPSRLLATRGCCSSPPSCGFE
jgi:hypothetical protein